MRVAPGFLPGVVVGVVLTSAVSVGVVVRPLAQADDAPADNPELVRLYEDDQADRRPSGGASIDWRYVGPRDRQREARVKAIYAEDSIRTGKDYQRAAMVLQHASRPEDHLLAHEFCVVALAKGVREARWLAAASEDRFLMNVDRPQRFGTQYRSSGKTDPVKLYRVGEGVTDALRREMAVPTLAEARDREEEMNSNFKVKP